MPVILPSLQDPTDRVLAGELLKVSLEGVYQWSSFWSPLILDPPDQLPNTPFSQVTLPYETGMMEISTRRFSARVPQPGEGLGIRANACVCTPCGEIVPIAMGHQWFSNDIGQTTQTFTVSGQTLTGAGAALGNCRVVVYETGRIAVPNTPPLAFYSAGNPNPMRWEHESPVVAEAISDGSGNFTITVPMNLCYQLTGYKTGSPDVAGITKDTVTPGTVTIYLRDPTVPDVGGSAVFRPVGSAVVRRIDQ